MRLLNKNSKRFIINLFSDFILSKINRSEKSIIQVSDCNNFVVVIGKSTSKDILDLLAIKDEFFGKFKDILDEVGIDHMNIIDLISYGSKVDPIQSGWIKVNKNLYIEDQEPLSNMFITSEFPYGHSLECGRSMLYYSNYIFNHMYNLLGINDLKFYFTTEIDTEEDFKIDIVSNSKINKEKIKSLVLDVFNFDLKDFNESLVGYDLIEDLTHQNKEKPYMKQDKLKHVIML
jgi:hypothetical protein